MTTMSYLLNDQMELISSANEAFNRRKQLCPFELTPDEIIDVMHEPGIARRVRELMDNKPKALHWDRHAMLVLPTGDERLLAIKIELRSRASMPLPVNHSAAPEVYAHQAAVVVTCWAGPETVRLLDWAWKAVQVEIENRWAMKIIRMLVKKTTTHQQVHRYMPELYSLLAQQQEATVPKNAYTHRRIVDVHEALKEIGSARATKIDLDGVSVRNRSDLKTLVTQTLLLQVHDGIGKGTNFDNTWVELK